jgi:hypothetical protein
MLTENTGEYYATLSARAAQNDIHAPKNTHPAAGLEQERHALNERNCEGDTHGRKENAKKM